MIGMYQALYLRDDNLVDRALLLDTHGLKKILVDVVNSQHNQENHVVKVMGYLLPLNKNNVRYLI